MQEIVIMARGIGDTGQAAVLDGGEIRRLLKIAGTTNHADRDVTVVVLSYWLGLRAKELASLKVGDVYLPSGEIRQALHLESSYTKRAKVRDAYLSSDALQKRLKEYWLGFASKFDPSKPLFMTRSGKAFTANGMVHLLRHLHALAGIDGGGSHSERRTMTTRLAEAGVDLKSIAALAYPSGQAAF
jgi:integrase/recombinase XerD